jgi:hypothetical protein
MRRHELRLWAEIALFNQLIHGNRFHSNDRRRREAFSMTMLPMLLWSA